MKFCTNCGEELDDADIFCPNCGNSVSDNINDKSNINKFSNKSISDIINPLLERPKLLLLIIVILILFIGVSSIFNSNSNFGLNTGGGQDITVYGVNFHIPEGFKYYELAGNPERETQYSLSEGRQALAFIHIRVSDGAPYTFGNQYTYKTTINGKECYITSGNPMLCMYQSNGKFVQLNVPRSYTYNNKVISYEELLAQIIR